ncbi:MAG: alpha-ketoacid dehydrogenase subunit beta [Actinobacteria bacterium]|nr:alpha-ketoacid dehydrogenase subunit beta [Actinomycetota bacterium]
MQQMMRLNNDIYLMGEDVAEYGGIFGVSKGMVDEFGKNRVINTPISEEAIVGLGVGSAVTGMRPIVEIMFMDFITIALDEIINQAAKIHYMFYGQANVPLVVRTVIGAGLGHAAQHSQSLEALVTHIPGLKVVMPSTPYDAKGLLISAINDENPVIFIEHKLLYKDKNFLEEVPEEIYEIPIGKGDIKRKGKDISILASSFMVRKALETSIKLYEKEKIDCEVIDLRSLKPMDIDLVLESIKKTGRLLCVEEACGFGGYMGEVVSQVVEKGFDYLDAPIIRVASKNCPIPYSIPLEEEVIPNTDKIKEGVLRVLNQV